jgi:hypothetical protein
MPNITKYCRELGRIMLLFAGKKLKKRQRRFYANANRFRT